MPYVKLDGDILSSTIWCADSDTRIVWITMLLMADSTGFVAGTAPGIARIAGVPLETTKAALQLFQSPDPDSRTEDNQGRRIEKVDGGFYILNYEKYRKKDHTNAERQRRFRDRKENNNIDKCNAVTSLPVTQAEAEAEANKEKIEAYVVSKATDPCPHQEIIKLYHDTLPSCPPVRIWNARRQALLRARWNEEKERQDLKWWAGYFKFVSESPFLTGKTQKPFFADLEWLVSPKNFVKVYEGKYHNG